MSDNKILELLKELKSHKWVDLTHEFGPDSPHFPLFKPAEFKTIFTHEDGFFVKEYTFAGQYGTHIDPPVHFEKEKPIYINNIDLKNLVLPLVVIDNTAKTDIDPDYSLTVEDIKNWEKNNGPIPKESFVALRTNWSQRWFDVKLFENKDENGQNHYPGWSVEALKYIYEVRGAIANGHETFDTDTAVEQKNGFPAEYYVLSTGHYQIELLANLDKVPETGAVIFISVPKAQEAPGFPVRVFAVLP